MSHPTPHTNSNTASTNPASVPVSSSSAPDGLPLPSRYWAILAIALGITVSVLDGSIANVSLPTIARDLNTTPAASIWIVNAYQLAITISLLSLSSLGDLWGYRRVYIVGLSLFSCTSLLCACSDSLATLVIARTLQGFGAAAITSVNTALIRIIYPSRFLARGLGINALVVSVSAAAGPTVASAILSITDWPWLFAINIPIGIAALTLSYKFLPTNPTRREHRKFDIIGGIMNACFFFLLIGLIEGASHELSGHVLLVGLGLLIVVGTIFVRRELHREFPLLPIDLLRIPIFSMSVSTSVFSFMAQMLAMVSLPFFLQGELGKDEVTCGLLMTPWPLATMICAPWPAFLLSGSTQDCWEESDSPSSQVDSFCSACWTPMLLPAILFGAWLFAVADSDCSKPRTTVQLSPLPLAIAAVEPVECSAPPAFWGRPVEQLWQPCCSD